MKRAILIFFVIFYSCSRTTLLAVKDEYGLNVTYKNLKDFKDTSKVVICFNTHNSRIKRAFMQIKDKFKEGHDYIIPSGVFDYAFIRDTDTIYASSNLNYWLYKDKVVLYQSPVFNVNDLNLNRKKFDGYE